MPYSQRGPLIPRMADEGAVSTAWERFVREQSLAEGGGGLEVRPVVLDSWRRCQLGAVNPESQGAPGVESERVRRLQWQNRDLCDAARPVLDGLRDIFRECGTLVLLSDPGGTILDLHGGSLARSAGEEINLAPGGCWMETAIGTNAIGTAIATGSPVQIHADEHFCVEVKRWTCAAAPILSPLGPARTLLGVLDVSGVKETLHGHTLGLVVAAARQIEGELARRDSVLHARLLAAAMNDFVRYASDCLVLFDHRGRVVRAAGSIQTARERHGVRLPFEVGAQLPALDLALPEIDRRAQRPGWLQSAWLHPVREGESEGQREGELGTLLIIPLASPSRPARQPPGQAPGAGLPGNAPGDPFAEIIGHSDTLLATVARARRIAPLDLPVLLLGETGAGKELFARALHRANPRAAGPFVAVNCGALTRELLASELFGYAEGAFTGARRGGLPGKFEQADGGTLFLDEIGEMPLDMQPHLLRVLQDGVVVRLGDTRERRVNVRIIAATNRDLLTEVGANRFREDLFHRLCVVSLPLPALRERPGDIDAIVGHLNLRLAEKYGCRPKHIAPDILAALRAYRWPGNIRELQNVFEAMFALSEGDGLEDALLPPHLRHPRQIEPPSLPLPEAAPHTPPAEAPRHGAGRLHDLEREAVRAAVANAAGNLSQAARTLGIARSTLYVKLAALKEAPPDGLPTGCVAQPPDR